MQVVRNILLYIAELSRVTKDAFERRELVNTAMSALVALLVVWVTVQGLEQIPGIGVEAHEKTWISGLWLIVFFLVVAPYHLWREQRKKIESFEDKLKPKLKCSFGSDVPACVVPTTFTGTGTEVTYYRVKLENTGAEAVHDCSGHLISIDIDGRRGWDFGSQALPIAPGHRPEPTSKDVMDLVPEFLDVFYIDEHDQVSIVWPHNAPKPNAFPDFFFSEHAKFVFHIVVSAPSTSSVPVDVTLDWAGDRKTARVY